LLLFVALFNIPVATAQEENSVSSRPLPQHQRLQQAYNFYDEMASDMHWFEFPLDICLRRGDTSDYIWGIKSNLLILGDLPSQAFIASNEFDSLMYQALIHFQERHGLLADGVFGQATIAAMNVPVAQRMEQLTLNIGRWKTLDTTMSQPYIMVNIPDFTLQVIENNETALQLRVVVGKSSTKTPLLQSTITQVVLNPSWYVPRSIIQNEIVPLQKKNKSYLDMHQMKLYDIRSGKRTAIDPDKVDWSTVSAGNFPYYVEQLPGPANALGRIKFLFPNPFDVYLHDTPQKALFQHPVRMYSHGCVRVEKPVELAAYLLGKDQNLDQKKITQLIDAGEKNKFIKLQKPVPVTITYITAWVDDEWRLHFRNDVYKYDRQEEKVDVAQANVTHVHP
jgi:murein L,D-transpeptidase YcbB/YkuD